MTFFELKNGDVFDMITFTEVEALLPPTDSILRVTKKCNSFLVNSTNPFYFYNLNKVRGNKSTFFLLCQLIAPSTVDLAAERKIPYRD